MEEEMFRRPRRWWDDSLWDGIGLEVDGGEDDDGDDDDD
jgi:hypothetical protein